MSSHRYSLLASTLLLLLLGVADGFGMTAKSKKSSRASQEAIEIFNRQYPFGREPPKRGAFLDFGMPTRDLDGTLLKSGGGGKRLSDITEKQAGTAFAALAKLYGDENALEMVKIQPLALAFNSKQFEPSLKELSTIFGDDEAKALVLRNPGLLAVKPEEAAKTTDQTMTFSYLLAATRPISLVGMPGLLLLLLVPALEDLTGIEIRADLLSSLTGN